MKEALERAEALKKQANTVLVDTRYPEAVEQYTLAIKVCMYCIYVLQYEVSIYVLLYRTLPAPFHGVGAERKRACFCPRGFLFLEGPG